MLDPYRIKSLVLGIVVLMLGAFYWWSGGFSPGPAVIGVYNVQSGQPVMGVALAIAGEGKEQQRLGFTDRKGQLVVEGRSLGDLKQVIVQSADFEMVAEAGKAAPALAVDIPLYVRPAPKPQP